MNGLNIAVNVNGCIFKFHDKIKKFRIIINKYILIAQNVTQNLYLILKQIEKHGKKIKHSKCTHIQQFKISSKCLEHSVV